MNLKISDEAVFDDLPGDGLVPKPARGCGLQSKDNCLFIRIAGKAQRLLVVRDATLALFDVCDPAHPKKLSTLELPGPLQQRGTPVQAQSVGETLCVADYQGYLLIDAKDETALKLNYALRTDSQRVGSWFREGEVFFSYYLNRGEDPTKYRQDHGSSAAEAAQYPEGDGFFRQPWRGAPDTIEKVAEKKEMSEVYAAIDAPVGAVLMTQEGLSIYNAKKNESDNGKRWSTATPDLFRLSDDKALALEGMFDSKVAARLLDISGKKPKVLQDLFKKYNVKIFAKEQGADRVWFILQKNNAHYWASVDHEGETSEPVELPSESYWNFARFMAVDGQGARVWFDESKTRTIEFT